MAELEDGPEKDSEIGENRESGQEEAGPGTQPADTHSGAVSGRPQATQALFRPDFDDDDD